jgi:hypothetical protein
MIIIFTPEQQTAPRTRSHAGKNTLQRAGIPAKRPLPDAPNEDEAVFTDPFGPLEASDR